MRPTNSASADFIRASGINLVVGPSDQLMLLHGINLTAYSDDDADPVEGAMADQSRADYENIAAMGLNVVRLNMWQKIWDDYKRPFTGYAQEGWEWLERQILWAKENNLYLLLDMHAPAGGYQGPTYATKTRFWGAGAVAVSNRTRLTQFWVALADRYQHEPVIAGYDLINEPCPQNDAQWTSYALELVDAIRAVDTHHLLDVEVDLNNEVPFVLPRSNILYDFHSYNPWRFAAQFMPPLGYGDLGIWGVSNRPAVRYPTSSQATNYALVASGTSDWQKYTSDVYVASTALSLALEPLFCSASPAGTLYFDDFTINEYDPSGAFVRECMIVNPEATPANPSLVTPVYPLPSFLNAWSVSGGTLGASSVDPHCGGAAFSLSGISTASNNKLLFPVRQNYRYTIEGWIKASGLTATGSGYGFRLYTMPAYATNDWLTRDFMEREMRGYGLDFYRSNNVPCNVGEFGVSQMAISLGRNGLGWVRDMVDICEKYHASWDYYVYRSALFGVYNNLYGSGHRPSERNDALYDFFKGQFNADADHDGLPDAWELDQFNSLTHGAAGDPDEDGFDNEQEYIAGTFPMIGNSFPKMSNPWNSGADVVVTWNLATGRWYTLFESTNLLTSEFRPLASNLFGGAYTGAVSALGPQGFLRLGVRMAD